jgi:peptidoglycan/LPS O-acetylase OafA/YrhL
MAQLRKVGDIQVLRAVAIIMVLTQHLSLSSTLWGLFEVKLSKPFWVGVELFFVISGLVVTKTVLEQPLAPFSFLYRRIFRLIPAMLLFIGVSGILYALGTTFPSGTWANQYLVVTPSHFIDEMLSVLGGYYINIPGQKIYANGPMWSLSVEFQFYAAFAAVIAVLCLLRVTNTSARSVFLAGGLALYLAVLVQRIGILTGHDLLENPVIAYIRTWRMDFMLLGVIVATLPLRPFRIGAALSPFLLLLPLFLVGLSEDVLSTGPKTMLYGFATPVMGISFAALLYLARSDSAFRGKESPVYYALNWLGDRSYSLYLLHLPVMGFVWMLFFWFAPWVYNGVVTYGVAQAVMVVPLAIFAAHLSFEYVERPAQNFGKQLLKTMSFDHGSSPIAERV